MRIEIKQIIQNSKDNQIDLTDLHIKDNEVKEIALAILDLKQDIKSIYLAKNQITDEGAIILANQFKSLPTLQFLDLQFNQIDKKGASFLVALKMNHSNFQLALHGNKITDQGEMQKIENSVRFPR